MARYWLGLDIGTSAVKSVLVDDARQVVAEASASYPTSRPHPLWSEQDAELWITAVETTVAALGRARPDAMAQVAGIGLSGQMHGAVLLGADDRPIRPVILWNDGRSHREAEELAVVPGLAEEVGVYPMPGFTAPKILWLQRHEPETFARIRRLLLPKDYVRLTLTGETATDMCDAAGAWLLDEARRQWSMRAAGAIGLTRDQLPPLLEGNALAGRLRPEIAGRWGLPAGTPVATGTGDAAAGGIGIAAIRRDRAFLSLGTSGQIFVPVDTYSHAIAPLVHSFAHGLPGLWFQMAAMLNGASAIGWTAGLLGQDVADLSARAALGYAGPGEVMFLPYLTGERTPHNDPHARGVFFGMTPRTTPEAIMQAALEGVAYTAADARDALLAAGTQIESLGLIGGGARNDFWAGIIASVVDRPIRRYRGADKGPAFGATLLARMAATGEAPGEICLVPDIDREFLPDPRLVDVYAERLARFRALYQALKPQFARAAGEG